MESDALSAPRPDAGQLVATVQDIIVSIVSYEEIYWAGAGLLTALIVFAGVRQRINAFWTRFGRWKSDLPVLLSVERVHFINYVRDKGYLEENTSPGDAQDRIVIKTAAVVFDRDKEWLEGIGERAITLYVVGNRWYRQTQSLIRLKWWLLIATTQATFAVTIIIYVHDGSAWRIPVLSLLVSWPLAWVCVLGAVHHMATEWIMKVQGPEGVVEHATRVIARRRFDVFETEGEEP